MSVQRPPNPLDTVCQHLSISHLMANGNQSDIHPSHVDTELDGLYEFAKIVQPIIHQNPGRLRAAELLLDAVGLHLEFTGFPNLDRSRKPHIFVANSPGCALVDAAIGTRLVARLGLPPIIAGLADLVDGADSGNFISMAHPPIQPSDPRRLPQIAAQNTKSMTRMRASLSSGEKGLMIFPGMGMHSRDPNDRFLAERSFDRLAPLLLATRELQPNLHLFHIDYDLPGWWQRLGKRNPAQFYLRQWKAVLSLRKQVISVRHLKSVTIHPDISKQQRYALCRDWLNLCNQHSRECRGDSDHVAA